MTLDPNTWYFSLSALAQTLAALLGLSGIFVALKLEHIVKEIDYYKRRGATILKIHKPENDDERLAFDAAKILKGLREFQANYMDDPVAMRHLQHAHHKYEPTMRASSERAIRFLEDTIYFLEDYLRQKATILHLIKFPAVTTIAGIVLSFMLLSWSEFFTVLFRNPRFVLIAAIVLGILGIISIARTSYRLLWSVE